jgi:acetylglutamate kinase
MYSEVAGVKVDIGFVGEVTKVNSKVVRDLLNMGYVPVISPVAGDKEGNIYNVNADYAAAAIGASLNSDSLVYLSDVEGLYGDINDSSSLINVITTSEIRDMISKGTISGGMIPKMKCCTDAVEMGVKSVCLISGQKSHALLELFFGKAVGTTIKGGDNNVEGKYIENICAV